MVAVQAARALAAVRVHNICVLMWLPPFSASKPGTVGLAKFTNSWTPSGLIS